MIGDHPGLTAGQYGGPWSKREIDSSLQRIRRWSGQECFDRIARRDRVLFADVDEAFQIVRLKEDEADDVRTRCLPGAEPAREIPEQTREPRLEFAGELAEIARRTQH